MLEEPLPYIIARPDEGALFRREGRIDAGDAWSVLANRFRAETYLPDSSNATFQPSIAVRRPDATSATNSWRIAFYGTLTAIRLSTV